MTDRTRATIGLDVLRAGQTRATDGGINVLHAPTGTALVSIDGCQHGLDADHAIRLDNATGVVQCETGIVLVASIRLL